MEHDNRLYGVSSHAVHRYRERHSELSDCSNVDVKDIIKSDLQYAKSLSNAQRKRAGIRSGTSAYMSTDGRVVYVVEKHPPNRWGYVGTVITVFYPDQRMR